MRLFERLSLALIFDGSFISTLNLLIGLGIIVSSIKVKEVY